MKNVICLGLCLSLICGCISITNNIGDSAMKTAAKMGNGEVVVATGTGTQIVIPTNSLGKATGSLVIYNNIISGKTVSPETTATIPLVP
jgi:hypothetical protein